MFQDCKFVGEVDSGSESFSDLRGNEDFNAGYNVSCVVVVVVFLLLIVVFCRPDMLMPRMTVVVVSQENSMLGLRSLMVGRSTNGAETFLKAAVMRRGSRFVNVP